ncbi:MAG: amidohydrolase family protein [Kofleriaceae bacterium]
MRTFARFSSASLLAVLVACGGDGRTSNPDAAPPGPDAGDPDAGVPVGVTQCEATVPPPTDGICDATAGAGTAVALRGNVLADGATYLDGEVVYDGSEIVCVGCDCADAPGRATATVVDCGGAVISPGLINAHDHLNYNNRWPLAATVPGGERFDHRHDWRGSTPTPTNQHGTGGTSDGMRWNELRQLLSGTTGIAGSTRANGLVRNLDEPESRETELGFERLTYEVFALGDGNETFHPDCDWNYEFTENQVEDFHGLVTHTAEGITNYAHEEFRCQSRSVDGGQDFTEANVGHIHGVGLFAADYFNMARDDAKLVWSPRSNVSLYGMTAQATVFDRLGGVIALGTDWTYSGSATINREMACADQLNREHYGEYFSAEQIWQMATKNAAIATGADELVGTLTVGKLADLAIFRAAPGELHAAVINSLSDDVALVVQGGLVMTGEADVVTALGESCEAVSICGQPHQICAAREMGGRTYAEVEAGVSGGLAAYPAVFCDIPEDEPTCAPSRPGEYAGVTASDRDGDGIDDATDKCPDVFDPIRPIDGGSQADDDGDGIGDACDPTPVAMDVDGDGIPNDTDKCPFDADPSNTDTDGDGRGDVCDRCPDTANPDAFCPGVVATIPSIRTGGVAEGTAVTVVDVIVTGVATNGFSVQDPTIATGVNAGLFVFTGGSPGVAIGDRVTVEGDVDEYFTMTELANGSVVSKVAGTPIVPLPLTVAVAATEPYENVLVTLTDVTAVAYPYSCTNDPESGCNDPDLFELNDSIVAWKYFYPAATWTTEAAAVSAGTTVTGVMYYRYSRRRILPRTAADITPL